MFFCCFAICKMFDSEYSKDTDKPVKISIGIVKRNSEMLKFVPDSLKTKKMCKQGVRKLLYLLRCGRDQYKTQQMCDKAILENDGTLIYVSHC